MTDSLCRKRKLADSFIPCDNTHIMHTYLRRLRCFNILGSSDLSCIDFENFILTQCIFDFETRKKQMFTEARAFSRVTYFFIFWRASCIFS